MKKSWKSLIIAGILSLSLSVPAFAGSWQLDSAGYWYQNDDGSYPVSCWQWIDGDQDGVAENYYFDENGYVLVNTITPDGQTVNANGAWTVNGVVQTQIAAESSVPAQKQDQEADVSGISGISGVPNTSDTLSMPNIPPASNTASTVPQTDTVWLSATGTKYHRINNCGNMNPNKARSVSREEAIQGGYAPCKKCY